MKDEPVAPRIEVVGQAFELLGRAGRLGFLPVQGDSMEPVLRDGDLLAVDLDPGRPRIGDLLLFRQNRAVVIHRLLGKCRLSSGKRGWRTRGDGVPYLDPAVDPAEVFGRGVAFRDARGWWEIRIVASTHTDAPRPWDCQARNTSADRGNSPGPTGWCPWT